MQKQRNIGVSELAKQHGLDPMRVIGRLHLGWTLERALNTPVRQIKNSFVLETGQTLNDYCNKNGLGRKEYVRCCHLIKDKCLTPDEALNYHRAKNPNWKWIKKVNQRRRYGIDKNLLELPDKVIIELGHDKKTKYFYHSQRLYPYCKRKGLNYKAIIEIKKKYGGSIIKIVDDYRKGKYLSWYKKNCKPTIKYPNITDKEIEWFKSLVQRKKYDKFVLSL